MNALGEGWVLTVASGTWTWGLEGVAQAFPRWGQQHMQRERPFWAQDRPTTLGRLEVWASEAWALYQSMASL